MEKIWILTAFLIIAFCDSYKLATIDCSFTSGGFLISDAIYYCSVQTNPNILTPESAQNCTVIGDHVGSKTNDDVNGFYIGQKTLKFFPQCLEKYFKNLQKIYINFCKLEEIHQSDLKLFPKLSHFYIVDSIEVLEEGLFEYNPNLEWVGISGSKIIHIDPNVFDHLNNLKTFWFSAVPCVQKQISDSYDLTKDAIKLVKRQCGNSEFKEWEEKLKILESESKTSNSEEFMEKLATFEKSFMTSKFSKYRPLNYKFENLKKSQVSSLSGSISSNDSERLFQQKTASDVKMCPKSDQPSSDFEVKLRNISYLLIDIQSTHCGTKNPIVDLTSSIVIISSKINDIKSSQDQLKDSQAGTIENNLKELKETQQSGLDDIKESISDLEATLSNVKTSQNDFKSSLSKIKTSQNEIRISLDEIKGSKSEGTGDDLADIKEKLGNLKGLFMDFEVKNDENLDKMQKELISIRHKLELNFEEKIKGIEKRLNKKFEDFEGKFGKILDEKLGILRH